VRCSYGPVVVILPWQVNAGHSSAAVLNPILRIDDEADATRTPPSSFRRKPAARRLLSRLSSLVLLRALTQANGDLVRCQSLGGRHRHGRADAVCSFAFR